MFKLFSNRESDSRLNPRQRRLISDYDRIQRLAAQSSIFSFEVVQPKRRSGPPETYRMQFRGPSLQMLTPGYGSSQVVVHNHHEVIIQLVAEYPRSAPHMRWVTPIFHPNISGAGAVCLGGWGTHWAPSLQLDKLCEMLWDMMRFANYDTRSPFNQQAATWLRQQRSFRFPLDRRELVDNPGAPSDSAVELPEAHPVTNSIAEAVQKAKRSRDSQLAEPWSSANHEHGSAETPPSARDNEEEVLTGELIQFAETTHHDHGTSASQDPSASSHNDQRSPASPPDILFLD